MYSSKAHSLHGDVSQLSLTMEESLAPREAVRICWPKCFDTEEKLCFCSSAVSSSLWGLSRASVEDDRGLLTPYITDICTRRRNWLSYWNCNIQLIVNTIMQWVSAVTFFLDLSQLLLSHSSWLANSAGLMPTGRYINIPVQLA